MKVLVFLALVCLAAASEYPNGLKFEVLDDWSMVPDADGKLQPTHRTELVDLYSIFFNAERDVKYYLFTPRNPIHGQEFRLANVENIANSNFDPRLPTRFIIHGWLNNDDSDVNRYIRTAYLSRGGLNVIVVDWGAGARTINYLSARNSVSDVAAVTASFIDRLVARTGISTNSIKIVGHSLGAHVTGITGKLVTRGRIGSCVGLDPAGPLFYYRRPEDRMNRGDCAFVEVHHTNGWDLGFGDAIGDVDFYPNGGNSQPACGLIDLIGTCAHNLAPVYFAESILTPVGFWSVPCYEGEIRRGRCTRAGSQLRMGGEPSNAGTPSRGIFWLETASRSPFALGPR
jgi:pimeloyl-ACP methyl ester carboxylesterase